MLFYLFFILNFVEAHLYHAQSSTIKIIRYNILFFLLLWVVYSNAASNISCMPLLEAADTGRCFCSSFYERS